MKRYASPAGGVIKIIVDTIPWAANAAKGALKGLLLEKNDAVGKMPSRPSSCITLKIRISETKTKVIASIVCIPLDTAN